MNKVLAGLVLLIGSSQAFGAGLDIALSNETANISYTLTHDPAQRIINGRYPDDVGGGELAIGGFLNESGNSLLHATYMARGLRQTIESRYQISAGMKLIGGEIDIETTDPNVTESESVVSLALGFQAGFVIPSRNNPVEFSIGGFFAPKITSFSDADKFVELTARLQVDVMPRARAFIGYRRLMFDTNDVEDVRLDENAHFGLSFSF